MTGRDPITRGSERHMTKDDQKVPGDTPGAAPEKAHTELRPSKAHPKDEAAAKPRPRAKVMPKDLDDDDDLFNDMPV